jgi:protein gp37
MDTRYGRVEWGVNGTRSKTKWTGNNSPHKWNKKAKEIGERHRVFCASLADIFEDREDLIEWRKQLFEIIDETMYLDWLILTKRPENIKKMWPDKHYRHNVWLGTSPCNDETAEVAIPSLLDSNFNNALAPVSFLSCEPLVGPMDLGNPALLRRTGSGFNWVIVGGESGPKARTMDIEWARDIVEQCQASNTAVYVKQVGSRPVFEGEPYPVSHPKGGNIDEWPEELKIREYPNEQH